MWLFLAFLLVPLIEIALFIQVGGAIGLWSTLGIVVLTAILGTYLVRAQGSAALNQLRSSFNELRDPSEPLAHGAMILFSGALLLTPGFFTDAVGFALLVPGIRKTVFEAARKRIKVHRFDVPPDPQSSQHRSSPDDIIDGDYEEIETPSRPRSGPSGWTKQ